MSVCTIPVSELTSRESDTTQSHESESESESDDEEMTRELSDDEYHILIFESKLNHYTRDRFRLLSRDDQVDLLYEVNDWFVEDPYDQYGRPASWDIRTNYKMSQAGYPRLSELRYNCIIRHARIIDESNGQAIQGEEPMERFMMEIDVPRSMLSSNRPMTVRLDPAWLNGNTSAIVQAE